METQREYLCLLEKTFGKFLRIGNFGKFRSISKFKKCVDSKVAI
jgi:hypothetical protein